MSKRKAFLHDFFHPLGWPPRPLRALPEIRYFEPDDPFARRWLRTWSRGYWIEFAFRCSFGCSALVLWVGLIYVSGKYGIPAVRPLFKGTPWPVTFGAAMAWLILSAVISAGLMGAVARLLFAVFPIVRMLRWFRLRCELRRRGIPICIRCGYEGGDIAAPRCPECGAPAGA